MSDRALCLVTAVYSTFLLKPLSNCLPDGGTLSSGLVYVNVSEEGVHLGACAGEMPRTAGAPRSGGQLPGESRSGCSSWIHQASQTRFWRDLQHVRLSHQKPSMLSTEEEKEVPAAEGCSCLCDMNTGCSFLWVLAKTACSVCVALCVQLY